MYCDHCGNQLRDGAKFCNKCGASIDVNAIQQESRIPTNETIQNDNISSSAAYQETVDNHPNADDQTKSKKKKLIPVIASVSLILVVCIVLLLILNVFGDNNALYKAYIKELNEHYNEIAYAEMYDEQKYVSLCDVYGDSKPELIYWTSQDNSYKTKQNMHIVTYENGDTKKLFELDSEHFIRFFTLFHTENDDTLYMLDYQPVVDDGHTCIYAFKEENGTLVQSEIMYFDAYYMIDGSQGHYEKTIRINGQEVSEEELNEAAKQFVSKATDVVMTTGTGLIETDLNFDSFDNPAMSIDEALSYLYSEAKEIPPTESEEEIFSKFSGDYIHTPGSNWGANLTINPDGSFSGDFNDHAYVKGDGYNEVVYSSSYTGRFINPKRINFYTYSFEIESINYEHEPGTSELKESAVGNVSCMYEYQEAQGLANGTKIVYAYTSAAPFYKLPDKFKDWIRNQREDSLADLLEYNCLFTEDTEYTWFGPRIINSSE